MKRWLLVVLFAVTAGFGMTSVYSVEPLNTANSALVLSATEDWVATADSVEAVDVFIGQKRGGGDWVATIGDDQGVPIQDAHRLSPACTAYSFVHFVFAPAVSVRKGAKYQLAVKHSLSSQDTLTEVFWDPNPNAYQYGVQGTRRSGDTLCNSPGNSRAIVETNCFLVF